MLAEKMLVELMDRATQGIYNFEDYGLFWLGRRSLSCEYAYNEAKRKVAIRAPRAQLDANPHLTFVIETHDGQPPREVVLLDENSMQLPLAIRPFGPRAFMAVRE